VTIILGSLPRVSGDLSARPALSVGLIAQALVLVVGLGLSAMFCLAAVRALGLAWPVTHPEGATVAAVLRVRDGQPLYQDFRQPPYLVTPYPPLQPMVVGLTARLLGLSTLETAAVGRGLTLVASLMAVLLIWAIARAHGAGGLAALAGASLLLPLSFLDEWGYAVRPDLPALALSLAALLLLARQPDRPWLAATVAVAAFFTKQTAIAVPVAATLWLALDGRWRAAFAFVATWLTLAVAGIALLEATTGAHYLLNTALAHFYTPKNGLDLAGRDMLPLFVEGWLPVALAILALAVLVVRRRPSLPALYIVVATVAALVTLRTVGSDVNYLIEPAAAAGILAGLAIGGLSPREVSEATSLRLPLSQMPGSGGLRSATAIALVIATALWGYERWGYWHVDGGLQPAGRLPIQEIAAADSVLSEEPLAVLLAGRPLFVSDTFHIAMLISTGFFDPLDLERRIKRSEFDLIVTRADVSAPRYWKRQLILPEPVRLAIKDVYVPAGRVGPHWLYRPERRRGAP
jgi:hypothetical protein